MNPVLSFTKHTAAQLLDNSLKSNYIEMTVLIRQPVSKGKVVVTSNNRHEDDRAAIAPPFKLCTDASVTYASSFTASSTPLPKLAPYLQNTEHSQISMIANAGEGTRDGKHDLWPPCPLMCSPASLSQSPAVPITPSSLQPRAHPTARPELGLLFCSTGLYVCILRYVFKIKL